MGPHPTKKALLTKETNKIDNWIPNELRRYLQVLYFMRLISKMYYIKNTYTQKWHKSKQPNQKWTKMYLIMHDKGISSTLRTSPKSGDDQCLRLRWSDRKEVKSLNNFDSFL